MVIPQEIKDAADRLKLVKTDISVVDIYPEYGINWISQYYKDVETVQNWALELISDWTKQIEPGP